MKIHYKNKEGQEKMISNIIHLQNVNNRLFVSTNNNGKEYILNVVGIEGIYYEDDITDNKEMPSIVKDKRVSLKAKGLYFIIQSYINLPNVILDKIKLIKLSLDKDIAFLSAWNELVELGYLKVNKKINTSGKIVEFYELTKK